MPIWLRCSNTLASIRGLSGLCDQFGFLNCQAISGFLLRTVSTLLSIRIGVSKKNVGGIAGVDPAHG
eukprot:s9_g84.t1